MYRWIPDFGSIPVSNTDIYVVPHDINRSNPKVLPKKSNKYDLKIKGNSYNIFINGEAPNESHTEYNLNLFSTFKLIIKDNKLYSSKEVISKGFSIQPSVVLKRNSLVLKDKTIVIGGEETTFMRLVASALYFNISTEPDVKCGVVLPSIGDYRRVFVLAWLGKYIPKLMSSFPVHDISHYCFNTVFGSIKEYNLKQVKTLDTYCSYLPCNCPVCSAVQDLRVYKKEKSRLLFTLHNAFALQRQAMYWSDLAKQYPMHDYIDLMESTIKKDKHGITPLDIKRMRDIISFVEVAKNSGWDEAVLKYSGYFKDTKGFNMNKFIVRKQRKLNAHLFEINQRPNAF